ncbi:TonB-dependent receptor [Seonamhaeicola sp. MEBiC1930]|uniref:SusC/RagA family TonB-linked outer membrane protein n=1 Tax=Seonamhaeicola sp. MEBiC01930 TaxID=2976768 RepID=UPI003249F80C
MKIKLKLAFLSIKRRHIVLISRAFVFLCFTTTFGLSPNANITIDNITNNLQQEINGTVNDANGMPLAGATVLEKDTTNGAQTDFDGNFTLKLTSSNPTLIVSYLGYLTKEIAIGNQTSITITLEEDVSQLEEVVVVGYGTQKKVNLTAAVSQIGTEVFENRPTANAYRSLQGSVPGLVISNSSSGGEPGAGSNINIRGFITSTSENGTVGSIANAGPLVLVDGIEMDLNDIDPEDIESVSVLKDAAAASIYGSRAAGGAVLVTTKSGKNSDGKVKVTYSNNFSFSKPTKWPKSANALDFAYTVNDARTNNFQGIWHTEEELGYIAANLANPGSAPTIVANNAGTNWDYGTIGIQGTAATNWDEIILKDWAERRKHNLSLSGGNETTNYYISAGAYDEGGLLAVGDESFQRYNLDAKIGTKANDWLTLELLTKFRKSYTDFPIEPNTNTLQWVKTRIFDLITKIKPTLPQYDPIYGEELIQHSYYPFWKYQRAKTENNQLVIIPKIIIEPIKDLVLTAQFNYKKDDNLQERIILANQVIRPEGLVDRIAQENTSYRPTFITREYFSPNIYASFDKSLGNHNINATVGYQSELNQFHSLAANTDYLITNNVISLNSSLDDDQLVGETISHWAMQSVFSRFRYNYKEKYLLEFSYRRDGSSRFAPDDRWAGFPSYSAGYNVAKEDFWPFEAINTFKLRGSYGTLGNQNVQNYLYLSLINTGGITSSLFDGSRETFSQTPGLESESLTWERVKTTDIGFDLGAFNNKLNLGFSWYRTDIEDMAAQGLDLPTQLGTTSPQTNIGTSRVQGWEVEASWRQKLGDFGYNIRAVLSDYKRTIVEYPNDELSLAQPYYPGQDLGEIWGYQTDGLFQTNEEATEYTTAVDQSFINGFAYVAGDLKYVDLNGNGEIDRGTNVVGDTGDYQVIGNSTPRYQYSVNLGLTFRNWDLNAFIQGVGKRDVSLANLQGFRGPSNGPFHFFVWEGHLDYFRPEDTTNPLGPNLDAYFPNPYMNGGGRTNKNYRQNTTHFLQSGAYMRLKSLQIGYTIPKEVTSKYGINNFRIFATGENLFTKTDLMFYDPEALLGIGNGLTGSAQTYPLSKVISMGVNLSF